LAALAGGASVYFYDTQHLSQIGGQMLFYATPVLYAPSDLHDPLGWWFRLNPLTPFLELLRRPLLESQWPPASAFGLAGLTTLVTAGAAALVLARLQQRLIFRL